MYISSLRLHNHVISISWPLCFEITRLPFWNLRSSCWLESKGVYVSLLTISDQLMLIFLCALAYVTTFSYHFILLLFYISINSLMFEKYIPPWSSNDITNYSFIPITSYLLYFFFIVFLGVFAWKALRYLPQLKPFFLWFESMTILPISRQQ